MKKLQKLVLHNATQMTNTQMKNITGGYGGGYGATGSGCYVKCNNEDKLTSTNSCSRADVKKACGYADDYGWEATCHCN